MTLSGWYMAWRAPSHLTLCLPWLVGKIGLPRTFLARPSTTLTRMPSLSGHWPHTVAYQLSMPVTWSSGRSTGLWSSISPSRKMLQATAPIVDRLAHFKKFRRLNFIFSGALPLIVTRCAVCGGIQVPVAVHAISHLKVPHLLDLGHLTHLAVADGTCGLGQFIGGRVP